MLFCIATSVTGYAQEAAPGAFIAINSPPVFTEATPSWTAAEDLFRVDLASFFPDSASTEEVASPEKRWDFKNTRNRIDFQKVVYRGQSPDGSGSGGGGGAGAAAATDPSAILTQLQLQNNFTPESFNSSGYANTFIVQPVLPFPVAMPGLKEIFPAHIMRPTLPVIAPSPNPDGPAGVERGLGDLILLDAYVHNIEGFGTILAGYTAVLPTSTNSRLGLREWQIGPAVGVIYKEIPKMTIGVIYQHPFSLESEYQQISIQPVIVRQLANEWYIRWGDVNWTINTDTGDYNLPLNMAVGKVVKFGDRPVNIFVEPFYTPPSLQSGIGGDKWGIKLNVTFLYPEKKLKPLCGCLWRSKKNDSCDSCF